MPHLSIMKSVALVGFAPETLELARQTQADEIWSMLSAEYKLGLPRIDRLFEIHPYDFVFDYHRANVEYIPYLEKPHPFPIYTQGVVERIPASVAYPLDEIVDDLFPHLRRDDGTIIRYFTSTFSYMLALAIHERFERVEVYGFEMGTDTEYRYQKPSAEFMLGVAAGRGIEVILPAQCGLLNAKMYAYEALHMITRSQLEALLREYTRARADAEARANLAIGAWQQYQQKHNGKGNQAEIQRLWEAMDKAKAEVHGNAGAMQVVQHLIKTCDMQVVDTQIKVDNGNKIKVS